MSEAGEPRPPDQPDYVEPARVYPPHEVQARLEVSASGLRRLAGIYERTVGPLPRDERGRVWPEDAVEALEDARALVRESRAVSIEAALRGQEIGFDAEPHPATQRTADATTDVGAAILEELRALRKVIEEQNARIAELEEAVRGSAGGPRELEASGDPAGDEEPVEVPVDEAQRLGVADNPREEVRPEIRPETRRGPWQRVLDWFGFGGARD